MLTIAALITMDNPAIHYPLYDISDFGWNESINKEHNFIFSNPYPVIIPFGRNAFKERMKKYEFVDCKGNIFRVADLEFIRQAGIRSIFQLSRMMKVSFVHTGKQIGFNDFQSLVISRAKETNNKPLEEEAMRATSVSDILMPLKSEERADVLSTG